MGGGGIKGEREVRRRESPTHDSGGVSYCVITSNLWARAIFALISMAVLILLVCTISANDLLESNPSSYSKSPFARCLLERALLTCLYLAT